MKPHRKDSAGASFSIVFCLALAGSGCAATPAEPEKKSSSTLVPADYAAPRSMNPPGVARLDGFFPNIVLTTQNNESVRFYDDLLRDKVVVINFMYASCDGI
jgi:protein SCO1/2